MASRISTVGRFRWAASVSLALGALVLAPLAAAHGGTASGPPPGASDLPPGPIKRAILDLQGQLRGLGGRAELIQAPVDSALRALERARGARAAGDRPHAALLDKVAEQWVSAATAVLRAVSLERQAETEAKRQRDLVTKVERAQALLTEQQARLGRLEVEVSKAEEQARRTSLGTLSAERRRVGAKERAKPEPQEAKPAEAKPAEPKAGAGKDR